MVNLLNVLIIRNIVQFIYFVCVKAYNIYIYHEILLLFVIIFNADSIVSLYFSFRVFYYYPNRWKTE